MKIFATSAFVLLALCAPALADAPAPSPIKLRLAVHAGKDTRTYDLIVVEHACAHSNARVGDQQDELKVCAHDESARGVRLDVDWFTRSAAGEYHSESSIVMARGTTAELGRTDLRLGVSVQ
jgi:hypothetical protein